MSLHSACGRGSGSRWKGGSERACGCDALGMIQCYMQFLNRNGRLVKVIVLIRSDTFMVE
jgi:hypothetical protein